MNGKWNAWQLSPEAISHNLSGFLSAAAFIALENQNLATTAHEQKDDSKETVWVGIPIAIVFAPGGGPWKSENTQSCWMFKLFQHVWGQRCATEWNVLPNAFHKCLYEFTLPAAGHMPFSRGGKKAVFDALSWLQMSEYREKEGMKT